MTSPIRRSPSSSIFSSRARWCGGAVAFSLLAAALLASPAEAGITFGRDYLTATTAASGPICSPGCLQSQKCTTLYESRDSTTGTNLCLNNSYAFVFAGDWQPSGRNYQVGEVVNDPVTGKAYVFVDVTVSTTLTNFLQVHPPLSDTNSWQPFSGLVPELAGSPGPQGPMGPAGPPGAPGAPGAPGVNGINGAPGAPGAMGATGAPGATGATGAQGLKGDTGATGPQGLTGATGPQGPKGDTGATGAAGAQGAMGLQGVSGLSVLPSGFIVEMLHGSTPPAGFTLIGVGKDKVKDATGNSITVDVYAKN